MSGPVLYLALVAILYDLINPDWSWIDSWHYRYGNDDSDNQYSRPNYWGLARLTIVLKLFVCLRKHNDDPAPAVRNSVQVGLCIGYGMIEEQNDISRYQRDRLCLRVSFGMYSPFTYPIHTWYLDAYM